MHVLDFFFDLLFGVLPIGCGGSVFVFALLCITLCPFEFAIILKRNERADCFAFLVTVNVL